MIVKSVSHKHNNFARLINYIHDDHERGNSAFTFDICHNLRSIEKNEIIYEFKQNAQLKKVRKNGTTLYHDILSFSPKDREHLTLNKLYDLSLKYIELRGTKGICFAKPHLNQDHLHVHFCFSGNQYQSEKSLRLTMKQFYQVREELEKYQIKEHPELTHSLVYLDKSKTLQAKRRVTTPMISAKISADSKKTEKVLVPTKYLNKPSPTEKPESPIKQEKRPMFHKEIIYFVQQAFEQSRGLTDFIDKLKSIDLQPFARNGKPYGILTSHGKYSFDEIQISKEHLRTLERFDEIKTLKTKPLLAREKNRGN